MTAWLTTVGMGFLMTVSVAAQPVPATPAGTSTSGVGDRAEFMIGSQRFSVEIPKPYCLASDADLRDARSTDSINPNGSTLFLANRCTGSKSDSAYYVLASAPPLFGQRDITAQELINAIAANHVLDNPAATAGYNQELSKQLSETSREKTDLTTAVKDRGHDDRCAFIGGTVDVTVAGKQFQRSTAGCFTAVGGRVIVLASYGPPGGDDAVSPLLQVVSAFAAGIHLATD